MNIKNVFQFLEENMQRIYIALGIERELSNFTVMYHECVKIQGFYTGLRFEKAYFK